MKKTYMERLECWARWMLAAPEAESVVADYRDIVGTPPRPEEELLRDLGRPKEAIRPLAEPKAYRIWLAVFTVLAVCILVPGATAHWGLWYIWDWCFYDLIMTIGGLSIGFRGFAMAVVGLLAAVLWFRRHGQKAGRMPKGVPLMLALLTVWSAAVFGFDWLWMHDPESFVQWIEGTVGNEAVLAGFWQVIHLFLQFGGTAVALIGVWGLVKARTHDRRWAAVYVLALAAMLLTMESLLMLMIIATSQGGWHVPYLWYYSAIFAAGAAGAGVLLC